MLTLATPDMRDVLYNFVLPQLELDDLVWLSNTCTTWAQNDKLKRSIQEQIQIRLSVVPRYFWNATHEQWLGPDMTHDEVRDWMSIDDFKHCFVCVVHTTQAQDLLTDHKLRQYRLGIFSSASRLFRFYLMWRNRFTARSKDGCSAMCLGAITSIHYGQNTTDDRHDAVFFRGITKEIANEQKGLCFRSLRNQLPHKKSEVNRSSGTPAAR